jgi:hypothetical protein
VLLACIALLRTASVAAEGQHRLAVLGPDEELFRAISLALSAWGVETVQSDLPPPEASQPEAVERATELARQLGVEAVVWISRTERGSLVWVFDARAGDVTTRILAQTPPFDSAAAAAVALSVKTVLRSTVVAPRESARRTRLRSRGRCEQALGCRGASRDAPDARRRRVGRSRTALRREPERGVRTRPERR